MSKEKFSDEIKRLEEIVARLSSGSELEVAVELFEEGAKLSKSLEKKLSSLERRVYSASNIEELDQKSGNDGNDTLELELFG